MDKTLRIAIIGDYNFTYNTHHATNLAIDHASDFLEIDCNYYWIKISEFIQIKPEQQRDFDAFWISPGPYKNPFYLTKIIEHLVKLNTPVLITGDAYSHFFETLVSLQQLNKNGEKLISDNLTSGNVFERVEITPKSAQFQKLYENHSNIELTASRFSLYPQLIRSLTEAVVDVEAVNQFDDPEIVSMKNKDFFVACAFCPQVSSTRELPHPLIYTFLKASILQTSSAI